MAANNAQKTHLAKTLNDFAQQKVLSVLQGTGKALPCSVVAINGSIVTVKFEIQSGFTLPTVTMPIFGPRWIRYPTQVGEQGVTVPADAYLGGVSGLGGGIASLTIPANLSALVFLPVGNSGFSPTDDPNAIVIYGPDGAIIRTLSNASSITVAESGTTIKGNLHVTGTITSDVDVLADGISGKTHIHPTGGPNTGPPTP